MISNSNGAVLDLLKDLGQKIAQTVRKDGQYLSPLLAAYTARMISLEQPDKFAGVAEGTCLSLELEDELIQLTIERALSQNDPAYETIKMQVTFESFYAMELLRMRNKAQQNDQKSSELLDKIVDLGNNLSSNTHVAALYRSIFKLLLANGCVEDNRNTRNVEREIAAALESVFPQAGLNAFNMMSGDEKRKQITNLVNIVLGIRLFNKEIRKGGAGLVDVPQLVSEEVDVLYERLEIESTEVGDVCYTLGDLINLEFDKPGTISSNVVRLQDELLNRRQYILLIHQLQHEVLESLEVIKENKQSFLAEMNAMKAIVGIKTSVPKEQVYPKFHVLATQWKNMTREREKNAMRASLFTQLLHFRDRFMASKVDDDIQLLNKHNAYDKKANVDVDFDSFVTTVVENEGDAPAANQSDCARLVKETTLRFMSLPLEHQGYCPWTLVQRAGLLLPGNPNLGIIRYMNRYFTFVNAKAMKDFVMDPEKYTRGVITVAKRTPALIHLLCLQPYIANTDISELFSVADFDDKKMTSTAVNMDQMSQTPDYIDTDIPDPNYEWNEWSLRRKAILMANLCNKKTVSTQTNNSHFRRDADAQTYAKKDGSSQTGIEKGTNVETVKSYAFGLRGKSDSTLRMVEVRHPVLVEEGTNSDLRILAQQVQTTAIMKEMRK